MMSRNYSDYQSGQLVYTDWQQPYQFHASLQPLPYQPDGHHQRHPYQARQPTSWDPPWLRQATAYQQPSSYEPDLYSPTPPSCWDPPWLHKKQGYSPYDQPPPRSPSFWDPPTHPTVRQPTSWDLPSQHLSIEFQHLDQPPSHQLSSWVSPHTQQPPCWEPPLTAAVPQPPQPCQLSCGPPTSPHHSATAPVPSAAALPPPVAISPSCNPDVSGAKEALFEDEAPLPAGIPPPCSPNQVSVDEDEVLPHHKDYSDHTSVPIESVDSMEFEHLGEGNDRIEVNGENKDRDRVDEKESLVLGAEGKRTDAFLDVDIIGDFMAPNEVYMEPNEVYNGTGQSCIFDPGGHIYQSFDRDWKRSEAIIGTSIIIQIRCHTTVGYWRTKQRSYVFDPGEDISPKLLLSTLFIVSWFPP